MCDLLWFILIPAFELDIMSARWFCDLKQGGPRYESDR